MVAHAVDCARAAGLPLLLVTGSDAGLVREKISGRVHRVQEDIQDNPMKATLYALGIGVIIGMILRR